MLVSQFNGGAVSSLFAGGVKNIGAKNPPVVVGAQAKAINDAFVAASKAVNPIVVSISVVGEKKVAGTQYVRLFKFFGDPHPAAKTRVKTKAAAHSAPKAQVRA